MFKILSSDNVGVVFFTPDEKDKIAGSRMVDEETIKDDEKLKEILDKKEYNLMWGDNAWIYLGNYIKIIY